MGQEICTSRATLRPKHKQFVRRKQRLNGNGNNRWRGCSCGELTNSIGASIRRLELSTSAEMYVALLAIQR